MKEELGEDGLKRLLFSKQAIGDGLVMRSTLDPEKLEITCVVEDSDHFIDRNLRRANYTWRKNPPEIDNPQ